MKSFDQLLEEDIATYEGRHDDLIYQAPSFYRLLVNLLDDPLLPSSWRPLILGAVAYFILPVDVISEDLYGPYGYVDDIFLCAFVAERICATLGESLILENWDGEAPIMPLIEDILGDEEELIGDERSKILDYIGFDQLMET
jgi:uncharacterized membrane protein YkvA (DUF1232 family)